MTKPWEDYAAPSEPAAPAGPWDAYRSQSPAAQQAQMTHTEPSSMFEQAPGALLIDRLGMSFKMTPEGQAEYLRSRGYPNVKVFPEGVGYQGPSGMFRLADPRGADLGDVVGMMSDVPTVGGAALGAAVGSLAPMPGSTILGAGVGGAAGAGVKQAIGALLPGQEQVSFGQRAGNVALEGGLSMAGQGLTNAIGGLMVAPKNIMARNVQQSLLTPEARYGTAIEQRVGPLSLGQTTLKPSQLSMEDISRRHPFSSDTWRMFHETQITAAKDKLENVAKSLFPAAQTPIGFGTKVETAFDNALDAAVNLRRNVAKRDFGMVRQTINDAPVMDATNTVAALDDLIARYDTLGGGDVTATLVKNLKNLRSEFVETAARPTTVLGPGGQPAGVVPEVARKLTPTEIERLLEIWGEKASKGLGPFKDLDVAQQRGIAAKVFGALQQDLDAAATNAPQGAAALLKTARDNYRANSAGIDKLRESVVGRYFASPAERTPERVSQMVMNMKPSELAQMWNVLGKADPELVGATRRYILEQAMEKATKAAETQISKQGRPGQFDISAFIKAMPTGSQFDVVFGNSASRQDIKLIGEYLRRASIGVAEGSQTGGRALAWDVAKGMFTLNPLTMAGTAATAIAPGAIAKASLTPQGRRALLTLTQVNVPAKVTAAAIADLVALGVIEEH